MTDHEDCVFCRIARGEIPAGLVGESPEAVAFRDLDPKAPTHVLVIPRRHFASVADVVTQGETPLLGELLRLAVEVAGRLGLDGGYRLVANTGAEGGQTVPHLHFHLLGGRAMHWPPG